MITIFIKKLHNLFFKKSKCLFTQNLANFKSKLSIHFPIIVSQKPKSFHAKITIKKKEIIIIFKAPQLKDRG